MSKLDTLTNYESANLLIKVKALEKRIENLEILLIKILKGLKDEI